MPPTRFSFPQLVHTEEGLASLTLEAVPASFGAGGGGFLYESFIRCLFSNKSPDTPVPPQGKSVIDGVLVHWLPLCAQQKFLNQLYSRGYYADLAKAMQGCGDDRRI